MSGKIVTKNGIHMIVKSSNGFLIFVFCFFSAFCLVVLPGQEMTTETIWFAVIAFIVLATLLYFIFILKTTKVIIDKLNRTIEIQQSSILRRYPTQRYMFDDLSKIKVESTGSSRDRNCRIVFIFKTKVLPLSTGFRSGCGYHESLAQQMWDFVQSPLQ